MSHNFLFIRSPNLEQRWPYVPERVMDRIGALGKVHTINNDMETPVHEQTDLSDVEGIVIFHGGPLLTDACVAAAPKLRMVGVVGDNAGMGVPIQALFDRDIAIIDSTRGWAQSVAEIGFSLALSALRRLPWWHHRMATETTEEVWQYEAEQFCDDTRFVNGNIGSKRVGIVGLGQIGRRVSAWCKAFGADVFGYDPFISEAAARENGAELTDLDRLVDEAEILFITVPPTPSAERIVSRERVYRLKNGAIVVVVTRAHGIDMEALRERIYKNELIGAFDVYDIEPIPIDDGLRGRDNVIHLPHIAGRTKDSNLQVIDIIAEDFARILQGETPLARLTPEIVDIRISRKL